MARYIESPHPQGTPEWMADRLGKVTGSNADALFTGGKGKVRDGYREDLVVEIMNGVASKSSFTNAKTEWGHEQEPFARMAYEGETDLTVTQHGFFYLPNQAAGCSVDGMLVDGGRVGVWEAKCPDGKTHYRYLLGGVVPSEYIHQVDHNLWITGADFADFVSFDPRAPQELQLFHVRYERDEARMAAHGAAVFQFLLEVKRDVAILQARIDAKRGVTPF